MYVTMLSGLFTFGAIIVVLWRRRLKTRRGRIAAWAFLAFMLASDLWVVHVLQTDPGAWTRLACGMRETRWGWRRVCL